MKFYFEKTVTTWNPETMLCSHTVEIIDHGEVEMWELANKLFWDWMIKFSKTNKGFDVTAWNEITKGDVFEPDGETVIKMKLEKARA